MCFDLIILNIVQAEPSVVFMGAASALSGKDKESGPERLCD